MKKKITYIVSNINKALAFEWIATYLDKERFELSFILLNPGDSMLEQYLRANEIAVTRVQYAGKKDWITAWIKIFTLLKKQQPHIIHCHLLGACIIGLSAGKMAGIPVRIYTRHHSSLHHVYHRKGIFWDKWNNKFATHIIAISGIVETILKEWEHVPAGKISYIPHGFSLDIFQHPNAAIINALQLKYNPNHKSPVIGVISRFTEWKGVQYIIPAFKKVLELYPDALLLLFNAGGDYEKEINVLLQDIPKASFLKIPFEENIAAAYHLMDVCVHTPVDNHSEAFGQIYIEAMAAGVALVATKSGIGNDILQHKENAMVAPYKDATAIADNIIAILHDSALQNILVANGRKTADAFSLQKMITSLNNLYEHV